MLSEAVSTDLLALHKAYTEGRLRMLVGAGASIRAGFPSWDELNRGLLSDFLKYDLEKTQAKGLQILLSVLPEITEAVHGKLGQEAVDLVWDNLDREDFFRLVGKVLYGGRAIEELPLPSLHRQIAAMDKMLLFTANYDPLLELALLRVRDGVRLRPGEPNDNWMPYRVTLDWKDNVAYAPGRVYHIHGFVGPEGDYRGQVVLTEGHYFELAHDRRWKPNEAMLDILQQDGILLIIGMSLNDPNLRRLLYERSKSGLGNKEIYAVFKGDEELTSAYQEMHWKRRGVRLTWVRDYDQIEDMLRQIKYGPYLRGQAPEWVKNSRSWLRGRGFPDRFFTDKWQSAATTALGSLKQQIDLLFPCQFGEQIGLNFLSLAGANPTLQLVARTQDDTMTGAQAKDRAALYSFSLAFRSEHGSSGASFVRGQPDEALDDTIWAHRNIDRQTIESWYKDRGFQDWRSIISIPILDSGDWVPVGVLAITSNLARPFWASFGEQRDQYLSQLKDVARGAVAKFLLKSE
jgi:hypothetical protein